MSIETEYDPIYVDSLDDIPISGPDNYTPEQKRKSLFHAETRLELDINSGTEIPSDEVTDSHRIAVMNLATHVLTHAAEDPSDVTLGDMSSGGGTITEYSSRYLDEYERIVEQLNESGSGSSDYGNYTLTVNANNADI